MGQKTKLLGFAVLLALGGLFAIGSQSGRASTINAAGSAGLPPRPTPAVQGRVGSSTSPDLLVGMSAYPVEAKPGDQVTFTVRISNPSREKLGGIDVWGLLPGVFEVQDLASTSGRIWINTDTLRTRAFIKPLPGKSSVTITIRARVSSLATPGESYYAAALVTNGDPNAHKNFSNWVAIRMIGQ